MILTFTWIRPGDIMCVKCIPNYFGLQACSLEVQALSTPLLLSQMQWSGSSVSSPSWQVGSPMEQEPADDAMSFSWSWLPHLTSLPRFYLCMQWLKTSPHPLQPQWKFQPQLVVQGHRVSQCWQKNQDSSLSLTVAITASGNVTEYIQETYHFEEVWKHFWQDTAIK